MTTDFVTENVKQLIGQLSIDVISLQAQLAEKQMIIVRITSDH